MQPTVLSNSSDFFDEFWVVYRSETVNRNKRVRVMISARGDYTYMLNIMRSFKKDITVQKTGNLCSSALICGR